MKSKRFMQFGMPTLIENKSLQENITLCNNLKLDFIELNMNLPEYQVGQLEKTAYLQTAAKQSGIYFTIHLDENLNIADFNHAVSEAYIDTVKRTIAVAEQLGAPVLNMHMNHGVHFTLPDRKVQLYEQYTDFYLESFLRFREECEKQIGMEKLTICVENTDGFKDYEQEAIRLLLQSKVFGLTWDIGHSNSCGNADDSFFMEHEDRLTHFHIHDSAGGKDHMTLGSGEIDLQKRLALANLHQCRCVVETKTIEALEKSIQWLEQNGLKNTVSQFRL